MERYVLTQDTFSAVKFLVRGSDVSVLEKAIDNYFDEITSIVRTAFSKNKVSVVPFSENQISSDLEARVVKSLEADSDLVCVCLDRFLLEDLESNYQRRFFRLQVTRSVSGEKTARQGYPPIQKQIDGLVSFLGNRDLILIDDGVFTGGTSKYIVEELQKRGIESARIKKFIGFVGDETKINGGNIEPITPINNMFEWIDIRDFGLFGGKRFETSRNNLVSTSIPYIMPWSDGSSASFNGLENFYEISSEMIISFRKLVESVETAYGRKLTIRDLIKAGFSIPTNRDKTISVTLNTKITDYLDQCLETARKM